MIGNLGDSQDTIRRTIDFAKELNSDIAAFLLLRPYREQSCIKKH